MYRIKVYSEHCTQNIVNNNKTQIQRGNFNYNITIYNMNDVTRRYAYLYLFLCCLNTMKNI